MADFEMQLWVDVLHSLLARSGDVAQATNGANAAVAALRKAQGAK